jgi:hypothetical protein
MSDVTSNASDKLDSLKARFDTILQESFSDAATSLALLDHISNAIAHISVQAETNAAPEPQNDNNTNDDGDVNDTHHECGENCNGCNDADEGGDDDNANDEPKDARAIKLQVVIAALKKKLPNTFAISPKERIIYPTHHPDVSIILKMIRRHFFVCFQITLLDNIIV